MISQMKQSIRIKRTQRKMYINPYSICGDKGVKQVRKKLQIKIPMGVDTGTKLGVSGTIMVLENITACFLSHGPRKKL